LIGDVGDDAEDRADPLRFFAQGVHVALEGLGFVAYRNHGRDHLAHQAFPLARLLLHRRGIFRRGGGVLGHFQNGGVHFLHGRGRVLNAVVLLPGAVAGLFDLGRELLRSGGHTVGHLGGFEGGPGDGLVLGLDAALLLKDFGQIHPEGDGAEQGAVQIEKGRGMDGDPKILARRRVVVELGGQGAAFLDGPVREGLPAGVVLEELARALAEKGFPGAVFFQQPADGVVGPKHGEIRSHDAARGGNALEHALGKAQALFEFPDHVMEVVGKNGQFGPKGAGGLGRVVAGGDLGRKVGQGPQGGEDKPAVDERNHGRHDQDHEQPHRAQDPALGRGLGGHFGVVGTHAHDPARGRHGGHSHEFSFAMPVVVEGPRAGGQGLADEILVGQVGHEQFLVHAVGDHAPFFVQDEAVAPFADPDGIDGRGREIIPAGAHGHGAEQLSVRAVDGLGHHVNQHIRRSRLHDALAEGKVLSAEDGLAVIAVQTIAAG